MTDINEAALDAAWEVLSRHMTKVNVKDALAAAIQAYEDALWQPIETAPKYGTPFDVWLDTGDRCPDCARDKAGNIYVFLDDWETSIIKNATHWRPLPEPPNP